MKIYKLALLFAVSIIASSVFAQLPKKHSFIIKAYQEIIDKKGKKIIGVYSGPLLKVTDTALVLGPTQNKFGARINIIVPYYKILKVTVEKNRSNIIFGGIALGAVTANIIYAFSINNVWLAIGVGVVGTVLVIPVVLTGIYSLIHPPVFKTTEINYKFLKEKLAPYVYQFPDAIVP